MLEVDLIETPEDVELERRLAGIGSRFLAGLIDTIILVAIYIVLFILFAILGGRALMAEAAGASTWAIALVIAVSFMIYWGYFAFFEMVMNGQSPGKRSQKIRVVKEGGGAITFTDVAIRNLLRVVDAQGGYAAAGICMFLTQKAQRLGDLAAGTVVVLEEAPSYLASSDKKDRTEWNREVTGEALRATGLTPEEYRVLQNFWLRRNQLTLEARERLLDKLIVPILEKHNMRPPDKSVAAVELYLDKMMRQALAVGQT
ncbi:MAG: RDD family protein, partial [Planctomycetota bacterium]